MSPGVRYQEPFGDLYDVARTWTTAMSSPQSRAVSRKAKSPDTNGAGALPQGCAGLLATASLDVGSSKTALVEAAGIEPASFGARSGLLRAQSAVSLLDPTDPTNKSV
jgi:uncharacterized phage protein gp47/JayE